MARVFWKRENAGCLVLVIHLIGWESGASFLNQLQREVKQNQCNPGLLSTLFWKLLYLAISIIIIICSFVTHFAFQAGPIIESILQRYPDYIAVKDLPHDDTNFKVNLKFSPLPCSLHTLIFFFSCFTFFSFFRLTWSRCSTKKEFWSESKAAAVYIASLEFQCDRQFDKYFSKLRVFVIFGMIRRNPLQLP